MVSLVPGVLPRVNHPDFAPAPATQRLIRVPPPNVLQQLTGPRPLRPVDVATLRVGDIVSVVGASNDFRIADWAIGTIRDIREDKRFGMDQLQIAVDIPGMWWMPNLSIDKRTYPTFGASKWFYRIRRSLSSDEAKGLSEVSGKYKLPYDVVGNIKEAITGEKPTRFRPDSKTGGTRRAKGRKYRKQVGRPSTRRVR